MLNLIKTAAIGPQWDYAKEVITRIRKDFPDAYIAGGYIRDLMLNMRPKDVDVFIEHNERVDEIFVSSQIHTKEIVGCRYMAQAEVTRVWDCVAAPEPHENTLSSLKSLIQRFRTEHELGTPVQIIMLAPGIKLADRIARYDFGFCQAMFDGENVYCTNHFLNDIVSNTATLTWCEDHEQFQRSMRRFDRFQERNPSLKLKFTVDTERFNAVDSVLFI